MRKRSPLYGVFLLRVNYETLNRLLFRQLFFLIYLHAPNIKKVNNIIVYRQRGVSKNYFRPRKNITQNCPNSLIFSHHSLTHIKIRCFALSEFFYSIANPHFRGSWLRVFCIFGYRLSASGILVGME